MCVVQCYDQGGRCGVEGLVHVALLLLLVREGGQLRPGLPRPLPRGAALGGLCGQRDVGGSPGLPPGHADEVQGRPEGV